MRTAPEGTAGDAETAVRRAAVLGSVGILEKITAEIADLDGRISEAIRAHPDGEVFLSPFKGTEIVIPAQLIAGFGDDRGRYPNADVLAAKAGVVPVAHQSGSGNTAIFRSACDRRLRHAVAGLADTTRRQNPWAQTIYATSRERGHRHNHALRVLGRAWLRVLWRCWQDGVPYDPERHGARRRLEVARGEEDQ